MSLYFYFTILMMDYVVNNKIGKNFGLIARDEIKGKNYTIREKITVKMASLGVLYSRNNEKPNQSTFGYVRIEFKDNQLIGEWGVSK